MRIANIIRNDVVNGIGVSVSLFVQGCPFHCEGCFNKDAWDFDGGYETNTLKGDIVKAICENGITRNFSILGGEPLCQNNRKMVKEIISSVKIAYPNIKICLWTGYTLEELQKENDESLDFILANLNYLIDGRFIQEQKDLTLKWRGSRNQNIYELTEDKKYVKINM
jgi:anaerobic ribonucleoside-triphosphate reductase activating protein